jgi:hypothetical protein
MIFTKCTASTDSGKCTFCTFFTIREEKDFKFQKKKDSKQPPQNKPSKKSFQKKLLL